MRVSDIITNVTKQKHERHGVDAQCLTCETLERQKQEEKKKWQIEIILIPKCSLHSN